MMKNSGTQFEPAEVEESGGNRVLPTCEPTGLEEALEACLSSVSTPVLVILQACDPLCM